MPSGALSAGIGVRAVIYGALALSLGGFLLAWLLGRAAALADRHIVHMPREPVHAEQEPGEAPPENPGAR